MRIRNRKVVRNPGRPIRISLGSVLSEYLFSFFFLPHAIHTNVSQIYIVCVQLLGEKLTSHCLPNSKFLEIWLWTARLAPVPIPQPASSAPKHRWGAVQSYQSQTATNLIVLLPCDLGEETVPRKLCVLVYCEAESWPHETTQEGTTMALEYKFTVCT